MNKQLEKAQELEEDFDLLNEEIVFYEKQIKDCGIEGCFFCSMDKGQINNCKEAIKILKQQAKANMEKLGCGKHHLQDEDYWCGDKRLNDKFIFCSDCLAKGVDKAKKIYERILNRVSIKEVQEKSK